MKKWKLAWPQQRSGLTRLLICSAVPGMLLAACQVFGGYLLQKETLAGALPALLPKWLLLWALFSCAMLLLFFLPERYRGERSALPAGHKGKRPLACAWTGLFLCWVPVLLAAWPGFFANDVTDQWQQVVTGIYNGHNPVLHTVVLGGLIETFHSLTGDYNLAVAGYTILQMLVLSGVFAYTSLFLYRLSGSKVLAAVALCYYGLFPVCAMFGICATKDSLYSGMLLLEVLCIVELARQPEAFFHSAKRIARFCIVTFLTLALRNNILVAFVLFAPLCVLFMKGYRKPSALLLAGMLAVMALYYGPLFSALHIKRGGKPDILCVPLQQVARVYNTAPDTYTQEEWDVLFEVLPENAMADYEPMLADQVKGRFKATEFGENLPRYTGLYLAGWVRAPRVYLEAFLLNSLYAWYPDSVIDGYVRAGTHPYEEAETCYFEPVADAPAHMDSKLPWLLSFYETIAVKRSFQNVPVVKWLFSIGAMLWLTVITFFYGICKRRRDVYTPLTLILLAEAVVLLNPIVLVRYHLILFFLFPVLLAMLSGPGGQARAGR